MLEKLNRCDERQFSALTGLPRTVFDKLLTVFSECYHAMIQANYEQHQAKRKRKPGAGQKGRLNTVEKKLFFILYYLKTYPTFDVMGYHFELDRSKAWTNVHRLCPVLLKALDRRQVLPKRQFTSVEELQAAFAGLTELFIDATERPHRRPQDARAQKEKFSGKKRQHSVKNTVIATATRLILFLGYTVFGSKHDYGLFKTEFSPDLSWFETFALWVDWGYLGIRSDYEALEIHIPYKKPRKSKAHPITALTDDQKAENRRLSQVRVVVEHAICGLKRFTILVAKFRNRRDDFVDEVVLAAAGLHNFILSFSAR